MQSSSKRTGLMVAGLWLACLMALVIALVGGVLAGSGRYGGIGPAYSTLSSGYWFRFTQTADVPIQQTYQALYEQSATAGVPASMTANVFYQQTYSAGYGVTMTAIANDRQNATARALGTLTPVYVPPSATSAP